MIHVLKSQYQRIFTDDGRGDRDFSEQEARLRVAQGRLLQASALLTKVSDILRTLIMDKPTSH